MKGFLIQLLSRSSSEGLLSCHKVKTLAISSNSVTGKKVKIVGSGDFWNQEGLAGSSSDSALTYSPATVATLYREAGLDRPRGRTTVLELMAGWKCLLSAPRPLSSTTLHISCGIIYVF